AVRAGVLVRPVVRCELARTVRRLVRDAASPSLRRWGIMSAVSRRHVRNAAEALIALADRLGSRCPVSPCGGAEGKGPRTDGAGPLYYAANGHQLRDAVCDATDAMNLPMHH